MERCAEMHQWKDVRGKPTLQKEVHQPLWLGFLAWTLYGLTQCVIGSSIIAGETWKILNVPRAVWIRLFIINQSELLLRQYPQWRPGSVAHQTNQCPKAKLQDSVQKCQQTIRCAGIYGGKAKSKRCVFRHLLKVAVEGADWKKRGSLFHRLGPQERKALAPVLVLTLGTEKWIPLLDLSGQDGINGVSIALK